MRDNQKAVQGLLQNLRSLEGLKELFRSYLSYDLDNLPIPRLGWPDSAASPLADDPLLFARHEDFHIIYSRLNGPLRLTHERNIVNRLLRDHPYALFIFSDDRQQHWHFVNVKLAADRDEEKNRDTKRRRLFRRIAVGPEERLRTATERLSLLDLEAISFGKLFISPLDIQQAHDDAFDVEKVTKQFFSDYQAVIQILRDDLHKQTKDLIWAHGYALQFLNRLMFLYFIQRKRWLGGNPEFIKDFWEAYQESGQAPNTFYDRWLRVLFFEAFNNRFHGGHTQFPQEIRDALALAPYLNGGLFQENGLDRKPGFTISDLRFQQIFNFLERYNFTIAEDSPLDQEVAVDPEMIGKVYESLVNVSTELDTRGDAGIFYTPRTEIDLMCRLALVDNLANHLGEDKKNLFYELVFALVPDEKEEADRKISEAHFWHPIAQHLKSLTVLDPACGSGSFLVGMLHILDDLQDRAGRQLGEVEDPFERKKRIIGQNLYGVDVMEWACRVAELRLWLALIIDAEFSREDLHFRIEPLLPNFTFNIRVGDSLVQEVGGINLGHRRFTLDLTPALKARITRLKTEKLKFYRNEADRLFATEEQVKQEEVRLFRDILVHRQQNLQNRAAQLRQMLAGMQVRRLDGTPEADPKRKVWAQELEEVTASLEELKQAQAALGDKTELPFVWDIAFVEIFEGDRRGFDIVIGNPPYVRKENILDPNLPREQVTPESKKLYKAKLARSVYQAFPRFFEVNPKTGTPGRKLDAKSDLYVYFYFYGLSLLNRQGTFCFITSNSWLDVGYGKDLQEFLLRHTHIKFILDNQARRSFAQADVNTIIALFSAPDDRRDWGLEKTARFVMFQVPFEEILSPVIFEEIEEITSRAITPEYRIFPKLQKEVFQDGLEITEGEVKDETTRRKVGKVINGPLIKVAIYLGNKLGGKYLRAPDIYWTILEKGKGKIVRLGEISRIETYLNTGGADNFFIVHGEPFNEYYKIMTRDKKIFLLPSSVIRPFFKSPQEIDFLDTKICTPQWLLVIPAMAPENDLVKEYIRWGEKNGYNLKSATSRRKPWYVLPPQATNPAPLIWPRLHSDRLVLALNENRFSYTNFYGIWHPTPRKIAAVLVSTITWLSREIIGKTIFGQGVLKTDGNDLYQLIIPDVKMIDLEVYFDALLKRPIMSINEEITKDDRKALDDVIFELLDLTRMEREAVYEAVIDLVSARLEKATSLKPKDRIKRITATEKTLGIWSGIPEEIIEEE